MNEVEQERERCAKIIQNYLLKHKHDLRKAHAYRCENHVAF